jgi:hypothetical protein
MKTGGGRRGGKTVSFPFLRNLVLYRDFRGEEDLKDPKPPLLLSSCFHFVGAERVSRRTGC